MDGVFEMVLNFVGNKFIIQFISANKETINSAITIDKALISVYTKYQIMFISVVIFILFFPLFYSIS
jgi:hypothetical protein